MDTECFRDAGSRGASVAERVQVRPITNEEGNRLLRILRRGTGSMVTLRRAQMVLLSAQAMDVPQIAKVTFTSEDRVRDVIHNFNADGFESLYPRYKGGRRRSSPRSSGMRLSGSRCLGRRTKGSRPRAGACPSWLTIWSIRGWSRTSATSGCARCCASRACPFNA
jgi:Winged helix-turn helix